MISSAFSSWAQRYAAIGKSRAGYRVNGNLFWTYNWTSGVFSRPVAVFSRLQKASRTVLMLDGRYIDSNGMFFTDETRGDPPGAVKYGSNSFNIEPRHNSEAVMLHADLHSEAKKISTVLNAAIPVEDLFRYKDTYWRYAK